MTSRRVATPEKQNADDQSARCGEHRPGKTIPGAQNIATSPTMPLNRNIQPIWISAPARPVSRCHAPIGECRCLASVSAASIGPSLHQNHLFPADINARHCRGSSICHRETGSTHVPPTRPDTALIPHMGNPHRDGIFLWFAGLMSDGGIRMIRPRLSETCQAWLEQLTGHHRTGRISIIVNDFANSVRWQGVLRLKAISRQGLP